MNKKYIFKGYGDGSGDGDVRDGNGVKKNCISIPLMVTQPCRHIIHMPPCSCLPCGISLGENVFVSGFYCSLPRVDVQTSM